MRRVVAALFLLVLLGAWLAYGATSGIEEDDSQLTRLAKLASKGLVIRTLYVGVGLFSPVDVSHAGPPQPLLAPASTTKT